MNHFPTEYDFNIKFKVTMPQSNGSEVASNIQTDKAQTIKLPYQSLHKIGPCLIQSRERCKTALNDLSKRATVKLFWVPKIEKQRNQRELEQAIELETDGRIKISLATVKTKVDAYLRQVIDISWTSRTDCDKKIFLKLLSVHVTMGSLSWFYFKMCVKSPFKSCLL